MSNTSPEYCLEPFAKDHGWNGPPFRWDEVRRFRLRCEQDAAFFHLYQPATTDSHWKPARVTEGAVRDEPPEGLAELTCHFPTPCEAVSFIMETFPIVGDKKEKEHVKHPTKKVTLEIYDEMAKPMRTSTAYQTHIDLPSMDSPRYPPP